MSHSKSDSDISEVEKTLFVSNNISIHYRISKPANSSKESPAIVLVHGVASNLTRWTEFLQTTRLQNRCHIIRLDLRGHARSQSDHGIGMQSWCKDIVAILDTEKIPSATIVGHSLGAQIGMRMSYYFPEKISGLVLIDPIVPSALKGYLALGPYLRLGFSLFASTVSFLRRLGLGKSDFPLRDLFELDQKTRKIIESNPSAKPGKLHHSPTVDLEFIPVSNYVRDMCEVLSPLPPLERIRTPTLTVLARNPSVSRGDRSQAAIKAIPNNVISIIDADHWPLTEKPNETREVIEKWCLEQWQND